MATEKTTLYGKLLQIQKHIVGLGKDKKSYGFDYVTGNKVLEHIKPKMNELGLLLKQEVLSIENTRQDYPTKSGTTSEMNSKVMMRFTWIDTETGQTDENLFGANGQNAWDKGVGSALTYGERYFLLKYFHIATDEDDIDNPDRKKPEPVAAKAAPVMKAEPALAPLPDRLAMLENLDAFKGLYADKDFAKLKTSIDGLTTDKAEEFKKAMYGGILTRLKKERANLKHAASEEQLNLIDKTLLARVFTKDEKQGYNTANYEYDNIDGKNRVDFLLTELKARGNKAKAA